MKAPKIINPALQISQNVLNNFKGILFFAGIGAAFAMTTVALIQGVPQDSLLY